MEKKDKNKKGFDKNQDMDAARPDLSKSKNRLKPDNSKIKYNHKSAWLSSSEDDEDEDLDLFGYDEEDDFENDENFEEINNDEEDDD